MLRIDKPILGIVIARYDWPTTHKWHKAVEGEHGVEAKCSDRVRMQHQGHMHFCALADLSESLEDFERCGLTSELCGRCFRKVGK